MSGGECASIYKFDSKKAKYRSKYRFKVGCHSYQTNIKLTNHNRCQYFIRGVSTYHFRKFLDNHATPVSYDQSRQQTSRKQYRLVINRLINKHSKIDIEI